MLELDLSQLNNGDVLAVGLSGGKDSVTLLYALMEKGIKVKAVNVDHSIRGVNSENDSKFVKDLCLKLGVELKSYKIDVPAFCEREKVSIEEGARMLRYECFYDCISSGFCTKIATAHHLSDSVETILFNLFRGTGLKGVAGIKDREGIIRPLKNLSREEIDSYAAEKGLPFVVDETNSDVEYSRNYIRKEIVPKIKEQFPAFEKAVARFSQVCCSSDEYLENISRQAVQKNGDEISISLKAQGIVFDYACIYALKCAGIKKDYEQKHLTMLKELALNENGSSVNLPKNLVAVRDYGKITIYSPTFTEKTQVKFQVGEIPFAGKTIVISTLPDKLKFDLDKIPEGAVIRTRREGDTFKPFGGRTKKLKKYLIDKKIPLRRRDSLALVADGDKILIIIGVEISELVKVDSNTEKIYYVGEKNV